MSDTIEPTSSRSGLTDEQVELMVGRLLRLGVVIAAVVTIAGGIPYLIANGFKLVAYREFDTHPGPLTTVRGILHGVLALDSAAIVQLGILLLIATPVARVGFSLFAFAKQHDRTYVLITTVVLGILIWSLTGGGGM